jgi:hypothetical protein
VGTLSEVRSGPETTGTPSPAKFREAVFADHAQIAHLESRYGLTPKSYDAWSHLWLGNPLYRTLRGDWSIGWVLEDGDGRIVASMGNIPLAYEFEGRPIVAASGHNWVAEPAYRSAALLLLDSVINQRGVDLYVNNTVTAASAAAVAAFECARVPVGRWDRAGLWYTHRQRYYETRLRERQWPFATPLSYALAAPVSIKDRLITKALPEGDVEVRACSGFDERFDDFWADLRKKQAHRLLAVRTREMLQWHYRHASLNGHLWIPAVLDGGGLAAYATFQRDERPVWGTRARLVDFQSLDGSTALLPPLLAWGLRTCRDQGILTLEVVCRCLGAGELLETAAPHPKELPTWKFHYRANTPELAASLRDPKVWAPSLYDGDASL